jgi:hypothetical protein
MMPLVVQAVLVMGYVLTQMLAVAFGDGVVMVLTTVVALVVQAVLEMGYVLTQMLAVAIGGGVVMVMTTVVIGMMTICNNRSVVGVESSVKCLSLSVWKQSVCVCLESLFRKIVCTDFNFSC